LIAGFLSPPDSMPKWMGESAGQGYLGPEQRESSRDSLAIEVDDSHSITLSSIYAETCATR
jgi:hypothetical protein